MKEIINGEHRFVFPPNPPNNIGLGRCQGPCRMIVTLKEAQHRKFGPCVKKEG